MADDVKGLAELGKLLEQFPARLQRNVLHNATLEAAKTLVGPLQAAAPQQRGRGGGALMGSITAVKANASGKVKGRSRASKASKAANEGMASAGIALLYPGKRYWHFTEYGTVKLAAKPWIRPAVAANQGRVLDAMKAYIAKRIAREAKKLAKETGAKK